MGLRLGLRLGRWGRIYSNSFKSRTQRADPFITSAPKSGQVTGLEMDEGVGEHRGVAGITSPVLESTDVNEGAGSAPKRVVNVDQARRVKRLLQ
ncbi:MAG: hypothetical protein ACI9WU_004045 [Myxococcota bacterium]|jgi:hypothetical protein